MGCAVLVVAGLLAALFLMARDEPVKRRGAPSEPAPPATVDEQPIEPSAPPPAEPVRAPVVAPPPAPEPEPQAEPAPREWPPPRAFTERCKTPGGCAPQCTPLAGGRCLDPCFIHTAECSPDCVQADGSCGWPPPDNE